ncbi:MAG: hypothetical protein Q8K99_02325 [Actinomycetota bacterium]|nr:hypothetical protein [Actinomycetota bacterium]
MTDEKHLKEQEEKKDLAAFSRGLGLPDEPDEPDEPESGDALLRALRAGLRTSESEERS